MNYCLCDKYKKRGGDDCSKVYCLNECSGHGLCSEGELCECDEDYYGVDCSVLVKTAISAAIPGLISTSILLASLLVSLTVSVF